MVTLATEYNKYLMLSSKLITLRNQSTQLPIEYQKLIAETIIIRLFYELDHAVEAIVLKLICGVNYLDGSSPSLLRASFRSQDTARNFILANNVGRRARYLEWTMITKITSNLVGILDPSDHFLATRTLYDGVYEDMRKVRNHVAHNSHSTRIHFVHVVGRHYRSSKGISAGKYLLSPRVVIQGYQGTDAVIGQYLRWSTTFLKVLTKSP